MRQMIGSGNANQSYVLLPMDAGQVITMLEKELEATTARYREKCEECEKWYQLYKKAKGEECDRIMDNL